MPHSPFILLTEHIMTAAWNEGVMFTHTTANYYLESLEKEEIERIIENTSFSSDDEKKEIVTYNIIEQLNLNPEYIGLKDMSEESAQYIVQGALAEYIKENPNTHYEGFGEVIDLLEIYCSEFISTDFFKQSLIDQAANIIANSLND